MITIVVVMMTLQSSDNWSMKGHTIYSDNTSGAVTACKAYGNSWLRDQKRKKEIPETSYAYYCDFKYGVN